MEDQSPNSRRGRLLVFRGALRISLGSVLFLICLFISLGLAVSLVDSHAGADVAASPIPNPDDSGMAVIGLACLGYGVWFLLSGFMLVRAGRRAINEEAGANSWPVPEFGALDTGLLLLGLALAGLIAMVESILGVPVRFRLAEQTSSSILWDVSALVAAIGLIWFGAKAVWMSGSEPPRAKLETRRNVRSPGRFVVLSVCSGLLYTYYWIYRNWEDIKRADSSHINLYWRTVGTIIPFLGLVFMYQLLKDIYRLAESRGIQPRRAFSLIIVSYLVPTFLSSVVFVWWAVSKSPLQDPNLAFDLSTALLGLVSLLPLVSVQETINRTWQTSLPLPMPQKRLSNAEAVWVCVGALTLLSTVLEHVLAA